jgi:hypothetical protein
MSNYPEVRLRRLRRTPALRRMFDMPAPGPEKFMWPVFVKGGAGLREPIDAMPGQSRMSADVLLQELDRVVGMGINSILIFGLVDAPRKNASGSAACHDKGAVQQAIRKIRKKFPDLVIASDVCVCAYTSHGHCGPLTKSGNVDNDAANAVLAKMAVAKITNMPQAVIDSIRNPYEIEELRKNLKGFKLVGVSADVKVRFERALKRARPGEGATLEEFMQKEEKENSSDEKAQQLNKCLAQADIKIDNSGEVYDLKKKIDGLSAKITALQVEKKKRAHYSYHEDNRKIDTTNN